MGLKSISLLDSLMDSIYLSKDSAGGTLLGVSFCLARLAARFVTAARFMMLATTANLLHTTLALRHFLLMEVELCNDRIEPWSSSFGSTRRASFIFLVKIPDRVSCSFRWIIILIRTRIRCHLIQIFTRRMLGELTLCFYRTNFLEDLLHEHMSFKADGRLQRLADKADFDVRLTDLARSVHCIKNFRDKFIDGEGLKGHDQASVEIFLCETLKGTVFENKANWQSVLVARVLNGSL